MNKHLYEITEELRELFSIIEEAEGELSPDIEARLAIAEDEYEKKIMAYYSAIKDREANTNMIDDEISRLKQVAATNARLQEKLKAKILGAVEEFGYSGKSGNKKLDLETLKLWTVNKDKVIIDNEEDFEDPKFCYIAINVPSDFNIINRVYDYVSSICEDKEFVSEINMSIKKTISKKRLSDALKLGHKVKGADIVNNPYLVMK